MAKKGKGEALPPSSAPLLPARTRIQKPEERKEIFLYLTLNYFTPTLLLSNLFKMNYIHTVFVLLLFMTAISAFISTPFNLNAIGGTNQANTNQADTNQADTQLNGWLGGGTGANKKSLDEEWEKQQEILANRRKSPKERKAYFDNVEKRREEATRKQQDMWGWQTKQYKKGEDPINEWRKRRKVRMQAECEQLLWLFCSLPGAPPPPPSLH